MNKKKILIISVAGFLAGVGVLVFSLTYILDSEFVKSLVVKNVKQKLDADMTIGKVEFDLWKGKAVFSDVTFTKIKYDSNGEIKSKVNSSIQRIDAQLKVWPLLRRQVIMKEIVVNDPDAVFFLYQTDKDERPTIDKLEDIAATVFFKAVEKAIKAVFEFLGLVSAKEGYNVHIGNLQLHKGLITLNIVPEVDKNGFQLILRDLDYQRQNFNPKSALNFLKGADINAIVCGGGKGGEYSQKMSQVPYEVSLTGFDLSNADRVAQDDALIVNRGTLDFSYKLGRATAVIDGFDVTRNPSSTYPDLFFVSADNLVAKVKENDGKIRLGCNVSIRNMETTEDFRFLVKEILKGFVLQAREKYGDVVVDKVKEKGQKAIDKGKKALDFVNKLRKKDSDPGERK